MAVLLEQDLDDGHMPLVDGQVEWCLFALVPGVEVDGVLGQDSDDIRLVTQRGVVDGSVTILVLGNRRQQDRSPLSHAHVQFRTP